MTGIALLRAADRAAPFAWRDGATVSVAEFLGDVAALAALLPDRRHVVNLCEDRYRFAVGFAAALCRGQVTVLPPSGTAALRQSSLQTYADLYCLSDQPGDATAFAYPDRLDRAAGAPMPLVAADQPAAVLFTSGSTGQPQPHARSWGLLAGAADRAGEAIGAAHGAALIGTVPHQHSYGLESLVMLAFRHGLVLHADRPFYVADILARLDAAPRPRVLVTTPVHLRLLLAEPGRLPPADLLVSATAPLPDTLAAEAERRFGAVLQEIYGCSEIGQLASRRTTATAAFTCLDGVTLRQDGAGTLACGPLIGAGTRLADIIELDSPARFRLLGRSTDLVNIAGKRSSLAALNALLGAIDGVTDGAFVLEEDAGEGPARLAAFAVAPGRSAAQLMAALRRVVDPAFLPRRLHVVDALPRDALGKLSRARARQLASAGPDGA